MKRYKFTDEQIGEFRSLLELKWSHSMIIKRFKKENLSVSSAYLSKLTKQMKDVDINPKFKKKPGRKPKLSSAQIRRLEQMVQKRDPPTQKFMANTRLKFREVQLEDTSNLN